MREMIVDMCWVEFNHVPAIHQCKLTYIPGISRKRSNPRLPL